VSLIAIVAIVVVAVVIVAFVLKGPDLNWTRGESSPGGGPYLPEDPGGDGGANGGSA
jgi:hypothetical protein